jgi:spore coat polysaccharide biosynthesis protein SpsF
MMKTGIIIFSRMNSTRLPGKAMMIIQGEALVLRVIRRAQLTGYPVVLATSNSKADDVLENEMRKANIPCYRGSEDNVLQRAVETAKHFGFEAFARLCGDRPLFSVEEMKFGLDTWAYRKPDLITNNFPHKAVRGLTTEIIATKALRNQLAEQPTQEQQEHITTRFYQYPAEFTIESLQPRHQSLKGNEGFAIDTEEDYERIKAFIQQYNALDYELESNLNFSTKKIDINIKLN